MDGETIRADEVDSVLQNIRSILIESVKDVILAKELDLIAINTRVLDSLANVAQIQREYPAIYACHANTIREINKASNCLFQLVNERKLLRQRFEKFKTSYLCELWSQPQLEEIAEENSQTTSEQTDNELEGSNCSRGRRLPKEQVSILEEWFESHISCPYLTGYDETYLIMVTGLEKSQIRNWLANKRRKDRAVTVSQELAPLLN